MKKTYTRLIAAFGIFALTFSGLMVGTAVSPKLAEATEENSSTSGTYSVTFMDQWVGESSRKTNTTRELSLTDKLGSQEVNHGALRSLAKVFLGWSDQPAVKPGWIAPGAKLFTENDTLATAFPNGVPADAKLYGVYYELNTFGSPFNNFDVLSLAGSVKNAFTGAANQNKVVLNNRLTLDQALPNTALSELKTTLANDLAGQDPTTLPGTEIDPTPQVDSFGDSTASEVSVDYYEPFGAPEKIHEVVLQSEFTMDPMVAMLVYRNPVGSNAFRPILSYDYNTRYGDNGEFNTKNNKEAGYTYMDLKVNLDPKIEVPETLTLEFSGYSWRPLYVLDANNNPLEIVNPNTDDSLGATKTAFSSLVTNNSPVVTFGVKPAGSHQLTVRVVLREGEKEKIPTSAITAPAGGTITDAILQNMTLRALPSIEIQALRPDLSAAQVNERVLQIADETAYTLAQSYGKRALKVSGTVAGHAFASAGSVNYWGINFPLTGDVAIDPVNSNEVLLGYTHLRVQFHKNTLSFKDQSQQDLGLSYVVKGKSLAGDLLNDGVKPTANPAQLAAGILGGAIADSPEAVTVGGVKWVFVGWNTAGDGKGETFTADYVVDVNNPSFDSASRTLHVFAMWKKEITPLAPTLVPAEKCGVAATVSIPELEGVIYEQETVDGVTKVTARPDEGVVFAADAVVEWKFDVAAKECPKDPAPLPEPPAPKLAVTGSNSLLLIPFLVFALAAGGASLAGAKRKENC
ncbi:MAG: hypothetical protein SPG61_03715 [Arcanobacterium sp.]|nr:hypothetical protein [Arcanobacterium sp.]